VRARVLTEVDGARDAKRGNVDDGECASRLAAVVRDNREPTVAGDRDFVWTLTRRERGERAPAADVNDRRGRRGFVGDYERAGEAGDVRSPPMLSRGSPQRGPRGRPRHGATTLRRERTSPS
jgi:hypothetical protein